MGEIADGTPDLHLIPFLRRAPRSSSPPPVTGSTTLAGTRIGTQSYGSDDWQWTSFANLSQVKYTVMVNGIDGVISWDGTNASLPRWHADGRLGHPDDFEGLLRRRSERFSRLSIRTPRRCRPVSIPKKLDKVLSHMNRLWFADSDGSGGLLSADPDHDRDLGRAAAQRLFQARRHHPGALRPGRSTAARASNRHAGDLHHQRRSRDLLRRRSRAVDAFQAGRRLSASTARWRPTASSTTAAISTS